MISLFLQSCGKLLLHVHASTSFLYRNREKKATAENVSALKYVN